MFQLSAFIKFQFWCSPRRLHEPLTSLAKLLRDTVSKELPRCYAAVPSAQLRRQFQRTICKSAGYLELVSPGNVSRKIVSDALSKTSPLSPLSLAKLHIPTAGSGLCRHQLHELRSLPCRAQGVFWPRSFPSLASNFKQRAPAVSRRLSVQV